MAQTANIVKKIDVRATLLTFSVGDELVIPEKMSRYSTIYTIARNIGDMTFSVSIDGISNGTLVRRLK